MSIKKTVTFTDMELYELVENYAKHYFQSNISAAIIYIVSGYFKDKPVPKEATNNKLTLNNNTLDLSILE